ncbi:MAG TPA: cyclic nucleotide-binding domain-containing protein, partial [Chitinophagales bacterium]|nr:cyclic nucleotide-binding domain-containing protein [Chitinophagales bacterium]
MTKHSDILLEKKAKELFIEKIASTTNLDAGQLSEVTELMDLVHYKKNQIVINEGQIAEYFYFIIKGLVKVYFFKNDKMVIERFEQEGGLFGGNFTHISSNVPGKYVY